MAMRDVQFVGGPLDGTEMRVETHELTVPDPSVTDEDCREPILVHTYRSVSKERMQYVGPRRV